MKDKLNLSPEGIIKEYGSLINMYEEIFNKIPAIIYINNIQHDCLLWANDLYFELMRYSRQDIVEMKNLTTLLQQIVHPEDVEVYRSSINYCIQNRESIWCGFQRGIQKNGNQIWLYGFCKVVKYQPDGVTPAIGLSVAMDYSQEIHSSKQLEELVKANNRLKSQNLICGLTPRELVILKKIAKGSSDKIIAVRLAISVNTAHTHRKNIMRKLGIKNSASLVKFAMECGLH